MRIEMQLDVGPEDLFSPKQVADLLGRSKTTIYQAIYKGELKTQKVGYAQIVRGEDIARYVALHLNEVYPHMEGLQVHPPANEEAR